MGELEVSRSSNMKHACGTCRFSENAAANLENQTWRDQYQEEATRMEGIRRCPIRRAYLSGSLGRVRYPEGTGSELVQRSGKGAVGTYAGIDSGNWETEDKIVHRPRLC